MHFSRYENAAVGDNEGVPTASELSRRTCENLTGGLLSLTYDCYATYHFPLAVCSNCVHGFELTEVVSPLMDFVMRPNIKVKSLVKMLISLINDV